MQTSHLVTQCGVRPPPARAGLSLRGVTKRFATPSGPRDVLGGVDLDVEPGEFVSLVGPSGSGKSTILNLLAGLDRPTGGRITAEGAPVQGVRKTIGYLTQHDSLMPWRSVADNVALPLELRAVPVEARASRVAEMLERVGLTGYGAYYPRQLSGGMQKRTMLARTLVYDPNTLLMDEPFGALDAQLKLVLQAALLRLWSGSGKTIVFVTHDIVEAITLSDRVVALSAQPTRVHHIEPIEIARPRDVHDVRFAPSFERHYRALMRAVGVGNEPELERSR